MRDETEATNWCAKACDAGRWQKRRIGVAYQFRELIDPWQWCAGTLPEVR